MTDPQGLSGYFVRQDPVHRGPAIYFNASDSLVRRRFTVAHELGHMVLGHRDAPRDGPDAFRSGTRDPIERAANQFAAELLMPAEAVRRAVVSGRFASLEELASAFRVSPAAMNYRVTNLQLSVW